MNSYERRKEGRNKMEMQVFISHTRAGTLTSSQLFTPKSLPCNTFSLLSAATMDCCTLFGFIMKIGKIEAGFVYHIFCG